MEALIQITGLGKSYELGGQQDTVFANLNLSVAAGEFLVLLGRSGSGKSTLLNLIAGLDEPSAGQVWIDGVELTALSETERTLFRRRHIGFIFQSYSLIATLTVGENLSLPLEINGLPPAERDKRIDEILDQLGLLDKRARFPDQLSGGEQQRVAIARSLIHDPTLILADEPTGNLDLETGRQVLEVLDSATRARQKTMIMATHSREVMGIADRVVTIRDGRLQAIDSQ